MTSNPMEKLSKQRNKSTSRWKGRFGEEVRSHWQDNLHTTYASTILNDYAGNKPRREKGGRDV